MNDWVSQIERDVGGADPVVRMVEQDRWTSDGGRETTARPQSVIARRPLKCLAGLIRSGVSRGRSLSPAAICSSPFRVTAVRAVLRRRYCRTVPVGFTFMPRCESECGPQLFGGRDDL